MWKQDPTQDTLKHQFTYYVKGTPIEFYVNSSVGGNFREVYVIYGTSKGALLAKHNPNSVFGRGESLKFMIGDPDSQPLFNDYDFFGNVTNPDEWGKNMYELFLEVAPN